MPQRGYAYQRAWDEASAKSHHWRRSFTIYQCRRDPVKTHSRREDLAGGEGLRTVTGMTLWSDVNPQQVTSIVFPGCTLDGGAMSTRWRVGSRSGSPTLEPRNRDHRSPGPTFRGPHEAAHQGFVLRVVAAVVGQLR
jgi:hypothetical protein